MSVVSNVGFEFTLVQDDWGGPLGEEVFGKAELWIECNVSGGCDDSYDSAYGWTPGIGPDVDIVSAKVTYVQIGDEEERTKEESKKILAYFRKNYDYEDIAGLAIAEYEKL